MYTAVFITNRQSKIVIKAAGDSEASDKFIRLWRDVRERHGFAVGWLFGDRGRLLHHFSTIDYEYE